MRILKGVAGFVCGDFRERDGLKLMHGQAMWRMQEEGFLHSDVDYTSVVRETMPEPLPEASCCPTKHLRSSWPSTPSPLSPSVHLFPNCLLGIHREPKCLRKATSSSKLLLLDDSYLAGTGVGGRDSEVDCWASMSEAQCLYKQTKS